MSHATFYVVQEVEDGRWVHEISGDVPEYLREGLGATGRGRDPYWRSFLTVVGRLVVQQAQKRHV